MGKRRKTGGEIKDIKLPRGVYAGGRMAAKKVKYEWTHDWILHNPEDWVMVVVALMGFANLMPNVDFGQSFNYAWPILITAIFLYKLGKRKQPE